jgi:large subunit ribosomal protein L19
MTQAIIQGIEATQLKAERPDVNVGDTVDVHVRIIEGEKERIQVFSGVIMKIQGRSVTETITVRRIVANEGVERVLPLHSPRIAKIEVKRHGHTRRARLYYLRDRVGKKRRLRDRRRGLAHAVVSTTGKKKAAAKAAKVATAQAEGDAAVVATDES